jgi:hypothetical protein
MSSIEVLFPEECARAEAYIEANFTFNKLLGLKLADLKLTNEQLRLFKIICDIESGGVPVDGASFTRPVFERLFPHESLHIESVGPDTYRWLRLFKIEVTRAQYPTVANGMIERVWGDPIDQDSLIVPKRGNPIPFTNDHLFDRIQGTTEGIEGFRFGRGFPSSTQIYPFR